MTQTTDTDFDLTLHYNAQRAFDDAISNFFKKPVASRLYTNATALQKLLETVREDCLKANSNFGVTETSRPRAQQLQFDAFILLTIQRLNLLSKTQLPDPARDDQACKDVINFFGDRAFAELHAVVENNRNSIGAFLAEDAVQHLFEFGSFEIFTELLKQPAFKALVKQAISISNAKLAENDAKEINDSILYRMASGFQQKKLLRVLEEPELALLTDTCFLTCKALISSGQESTFHALVHQHQLRLSDTIQSRHGSLEKVLVAATESFRFPFFREIVENVLTSEQRRTAGPMLLRVLEKTKSESVIKYVANALFGLDSSKCSLGKLKKMCLAVGTTRTEALRQKLIDFEIPEKKWKAYFKEPILLQAANAGLLETVEALEQLKKQRVASCRQTKV